MSSSVRRVSLVVRHVRWNGREPIADARVPPFTGEDSPPNSQGAAFWVSFASWWAGKNILSHSLTNSDGDPLAKRIVSEIDRVSPSSGGGPDDSLTGTAKELHDVLVASNLLLETIDLEKWRAVVDVGELPTLVDLHRLSDAIRERNPDLAFDLGHLERVVNRRELWNSIDLREFVKAKKTLDRELDDVFGEGTTSVPMGDSKAVADAREFVATLRDEAPKVLVQQEATDKLSAAREEVVERHAALEQRYRSNGKRSEHARGRSTAGTSSSVSLLPPGPLPDSVSTRLSTVPAEVPYANIDALPRVYGRRWRRRRLRSETPR